MALIGSCDYIFYQQSETETTIETVTNPDGTTSEQEVPVVEKLITHHENVYLVIIQVENFNFWSPSGSAKPVTCFYRAYESAEARDLDRDNYLFEGNASVNLDFDLPLYQQLYAQIMSHEGLENLISD